METTRTSQWRVLGIGALLLSLLAGFLLLMGASTFVNAQTATSTPQISNVAATTTETTAQITWDTDIPATSQVAYGSTTAYGSFSTFSATLTEDHSIFLDNLTPDRVYHYQVISGLSTTSTSTASTTDSDDFTFTTLEEDEEDNKPHGIIKWLKDHIEDLLERIGILEDRVEELEENDNGSGNGTTTPPTSGDAIIEQDGAEVRAGTNTDFAGKNFGPEELVTIEREGSPIGRTAFTNLAGSFTTGSITVPTTTGNYTYTFEGQESGETAEAEITVIP